MDNSYQFILNEIDYWDKNVELQFKHFMSVFKFWITIVTVPLQLAFF